MMTRPSIQDMRQTYTTYEYIMKQRSTKETAEEFDEWLAHTLSEAARREGLARAMFEAYERDICAIGPDWDDLPWHHKRSWFAALDAALALVGE